jgi:hypothetical protein
MMFESTQPFWFTSFSVKKDISILKGGIIYKNHLNNTFTLTIKKIDELTDKQSDEGYIEIKSHKNYYSFDLEIDNEINEDKKINVDFYKLFPPNDWCIIKVIVTGLLSTIL